ncbi:MAG TPA: hypothetical protein VFJ43_12260 [Bacteroidia bacterium]|nr:hypothetical protein [Bacteroidia bacterium]
MKKFIAILILVTVPVFIFSCRHVKNIITDTADPSVDYAKQGYVKGYVTEVQLDGCTWMIALSDSANKRIEPDDWAPGFQKDSLKVWVKYTPDDRLSICMAGQTVHIVDIKKR